MKTLLLFLWRNKARTFLVLAVLANFVNYGIGYWKGRAAGKAAAQIQTIEKVVEIQEKKNEILLNRSSDTGLIDSMFNSRF